MVRKQNFEPAAVVQLAGEIQTSLEAALTPADRMAMKKRASDDTTSTVVYAADERERAMNDFAVLAATDALEAVADEIESFLDHRIAQLYRQALDVYYAAEELSRDPAHAELLPHVEAMRRAHEEDYGRPIPPKPPH